MIKILLSILFCISISAAASPQELFKQKRWFEAGEAAKKELTNGGSTEANVRIIFLSSIRCEDFDSASRLLIEYPYLQTAADLRLDWLQTLLKTGKIKECLIELEKNSSSAQLFALKLEALEAAGEFDSLKREFISRRNTLEPEAARNWSIILFNRAMENYSKAMKANDLDAAMAAAGEMAAVKNGSEPSIYMAGILYARGNWQEAYDRLSLVNPADISDRELKFGFEKLSGMTSFRMEQYAEALKHLQAAALMRSSDKDVLYYLAYTLHKSGREDAAFIKINECLRLESTFEASYLQAVICIALTRFIEARKALDLCLTLKSDDKDIKTARDRLKAAELFEDARTALSEKKYGSAQSLSREALLLEGQKGRSSFRLLLANILTAQAEQANSASAVLSSDVQKMLGEALSLYQEISEKDSSYFDAREGMFKVFSLRGEHEAARQVMENLEKIRKKADAPALLAIASSYENQRMYDKAEVYLRRALEIEKNNPEVKNRLTGIIGNKAVLAVENGNLDQAAALIAEGYKIIPAEPSLKRLEILIAARRDSALLTRTVAQGETAFSNKNFENAAALYQKALAIEEVPGIRASLAAAYFNLKQWQPAAENYLQDWRTSSSAKSMQGYLFTLLKLGEYDSAAETARRELSAGKWQGSAKNDLRRIYIEALMKTASSRQAKTELVDASESGNRFIYFPILLGNLYFAEGEYERSEKEYRKALEIDPDDFISLYNMGVISWKKNDYQRSIDYLLRAKELSPIPTVDYFLAANYLETANLAEAMNCIQSALQAEPDDLKFNWLYCRIAITRDKGSAAKAPKEVFDRLEICVTNTQDREISWLASRAKVLLLPGTKLALASQMPGKSEALPVFARGDFIVTSAADTLTAVNERTGKMLWQLQENAPFSAPVKADDSIYCALDSGWIKARELSNGKELWKQREYTRLFEAERGEFFLSSGNVIKKVSRNGTIWSNTLQGALNLLLTPSTLAVRSADACTLFERSTGRIRGKFAVKEGTLTSAAGMLLFSFNEQMQVFSDQDASQLAVFAIPQGNVKVLTSGSKCYFWNTQGTLECAELPGGKTLWKTNLGNLSDVTLLRGEPVVLSADGQIIRLDANGKILWTQKAEGKRESLMTLITSRPE